MERISESSPATRRLAQLDGLRAFAIILVLVAHTLTPAPIAWLSRVAWMGWVGVDLFFVLSGFLIGGILLDQRLATNYYQVFYWRRFLRIVPLYAAILLPGLLVVGLGLQRFFKGSSLGDQSSVGIWFNLLFLQNFARVFGFDAPRYLIPTWSLAVEEQFYLLLPPLIRALSFRRLVVLLLAAILSAPLIRTLLLLVFGDKAGEACYILLPCRWDSLLMGVMAACIMRTEETRNFLVARIQSLRILWLVLAGVSGFLLFQCNGELVPWMAYAGFTFVAALFACTLLLAVLNPDGVFHRILGLPAFKPIATVSYALYLFQGPSAAAVQAICRRVGLGFEGVSWPATAAAVASLGITILAATLSWKFYESRFVRLGHESRFISR